MKPSPVVEATHAGVSYSQSADQKLGAAPSAMLCKVAALLIMPAVQHSSLTTIIGAANAALAVQSG